MPSKSRIIKLYIQHLHEVDHGGVECTSVKLQSKFWVPGSRCLIKAVKIRCVVCKKSEAVTGGQRTVKINSERLNLLPPFYHSFLDLFGPFEFRDTVKRRTIGKTYGIIFTCVTRA